MARSLVFTNSNSESITFERSPYLITNIEGLGIPSVEVQEQRSPFIDGTTEIDNVIEARDIVMTVSIIAPNDFTNIDTYRRDIIKKLNPKLNAGTIVYTTEGGDSYRIVGTPTSVVFRGKVYGEPFQEVQIIFHCHDPYWTAVNSTTVDIDKLFSGSAQEIATYAENPTIIQRNDGSYMLVYYSNQPDATPPDPDPARGMVYRTSVDGTTWSAESFIVEDTSIANTYVVQFSDDTYLAMYTSNSNSFAFFLYSADGITWTNVSSVNTAMSTPFIYVDAADVVYLVYRRNSDGYIRKQTSTNKGTTWSTASSIISANSLYPKIHQISDGSYGLVYKSLSDNYIKYITSDDTVTWSSPVTVANEDASFPIPIQRISGEIIVLYNISSTVKMRSSYDLGVTWSSPSVAVAGSATDIILQQDGVLRMVYSVTVIATITTFQILGEENTVTHASDVAIPCQIRFNGPAVNPRIDNMAKAEFIRIIKTLAASDYFVVDTGLKTVQIYISGIPANGTAFLDLQSTFFTIDPGTTSLAFSDETPSGTTATATVTYRERYAGI